MEDCALSESLVMGRDESPTLGATALSDRKAAAEALRVPEWIAALLRPPLLPLWFSLSWYITVVASHSPSSLPASVWTNAAILSAIVGTILNFNAFSAAASHVVLPSWLRANPFAFARFFAIPFCVSSYSSMVIARGSSEFVSIFPRSPDGIGLAVGCSCGVVIIGVSARYLLQQSLVQRPTAAG